MPNCADERERNDEQRARVDRRECTGRSVRTISRPERVPRAADDDQHPLRRNDPARSTRGAAPSRAAGEHPERELRRRQQEQHLDEDELGRDRERAPDLELEPRGDRVGADEDARRSTGRQAMRVARTTSRTSAAQDEAGARDPVGDPLGARSASTPRAPAPRRAVARSAGRTRSSLHGTTARGNAREAGGAPASRAGALRSVAPVTGSGTGRRTRRRARMSRPSGARAP